MQGILIGFSFGAILNVLCYEYTSYIVVISSITALVCLLRSRERKYFIFCISIVIGILWINEKIEARHNTQSALPLNNTIATVNVRIISPPKVSGIQTQIDVDVISVNGETTQGMFRLACYSCIYNFTLGERWVLNVRLKPIHGLSNPGGFDYEKWAFSRGIIAKGSIVGSFGRQIGEHTYVHIKRREIFNFINSQLADRSVKGVIQAISVGIKHNISDTQWAIFSATGTGHVISISGLHVSLVFGFFMIAGSLVCRLCPPLLLKIPAKTVGVYCAIMPTIGYALLSGFSMPTIRALIMIGVFTLAYLIHRRIRPWFSFLLAVTIILIVDPFAPLSAGFWLSFLAVASILFWLQLERNKHEITDPLLHVEHAWIARWLMSVAKIFRLQLMISLAVIPVSLVFFDIAPSLSPFFNLIVVPYFSIFVLPLTLLGMVFWLIGLTPGAEVMLSTAASCMEFLEYLLTTIHNAGFIEALSGITIAIPIGLLISAALFIYYSRIKMITIALLTCLIMGFVSLNMSTAEKKLHNEEFVVDVLDVGQGLAVVIRTQTSTVLFDAGVRFSDRYDMGKIVILPWMNKHHISHLSHVVISHTDRDHLGGFKTVQKHMQIDQVLSSGVSITEDTIACLPEHSWTVDGVDFRFLWPNKKTTGDTNNESCVLHVSSQFGSVLLPGDIETEVEYELVKQFDATLNSDVLIAPHHGSNTSSSLPFLNAVSSKISIVSRGYMNSFGHPHPDVLERLDAVKTETMDTAINGAITFKFIQKGMQFSSWRAYPAKYWSHFASVTENDQ